MSKNEFVENIERQVQEEKLSSNELILSMKEAKMKEYATEKVREFFKKWSNK